MSDWVDVPDDWEDAGDAPTAPGLSISDLLGQDTSRGTQAARVAVGGLSQFLPFGDEIIAGGTAGIDRLRGFWSGDGPDLSQLYDQRLGEVRGYQKAFDLQSDEYGGIAEPVVNISGALALPAGKLAKVAKGGLAKTAATIGSGAGWSSLLGFAEGEGEEDRTQRAVDGAKTGAAIAAALGIPLQALQSLGPKAKGVGLALLRKGWGARASDYVNSADDLRVGNVSQEVAETPIKKLLNETIESGSLGRTASPEIRLGRAIAQADDLAKEAGTIIDNTPTVLPIPKFERALNLITSGKIPANQIDNYLDEIIELQEGIKQNGGTLRFLQNQKIAQGSKFEVGNGPRNLFNQAIYRDLKGVIEDAAPAVRIPNKQLEKLNRIRPILDRAAGASENADAVTSVMQKIRTSGGTGITPYLLAAGGGSMAGGPLGAIAATGLTAASTPTGRNALGYGLKGVGDFLSSPRAQSVFETMGGLVPGVSTVPSLSSEETMIPQSEEALGGDWADAGEWEDVDEGEDMAKIQKNETMDLLLSAVRQVESGGGKYLLSEVGAKGPYQLMDVTGKAYHKKLGIKDKYDPFSETQSKKIAQAILEDNLKMFDGDLDLAVTAYHSGPSRAKSGKLGPVGKNYAPKIRKQLAKLLKQLEKEEGQA